MNGPVSISDQDRRGAVFVSYATADRKQALTVCNAIESRGTACWISSRDVAPGENYQEAIVQAIRRAPAMVLVFSSAANNSDEIKKELSLASRYRVPVMALRLEDVEPSDAFAYELSTRQWIDAFEGWDRSIDSLVSRMAQLPGVAAVPAATIALNRHRTTFAARRPVAIAAAGLLLLVIAAGAWWWFRPAAATAPHSMGVRLVGFKLLSTDLPATLRDAVDSEIAAAFNANGVVGVSTASAPTSGAAPAYALSGTIQRDGQTIRVITRLVNERSGETLWTNNFNYDGNEVARVPRHIAVDAGNVVRCGLFGASTYYKPLPDPVLRDYMLFCQGHWDPDLADGRKALVPAQRVVTAVPDFSWGWAAVAGAMWKVDLTATTPQAASEARAIGRDAADRAVAIDGKNSEALYIKAMLVDRTDWITRETLFKRALAARRLDCGCEHHQYGWLLVSVGRIGEGLEELHRANDMLALYVYTPLTLANALVVAGKPEEARQYFDASIDLAPNAAAANDLAADKAIRIGDVNLLQDAKLPIPAELRTALVKGYRALTSREPGVKAQAIQTLLTLPDDQQRGSVAVLLGALGATHEAFTIAARSINGRFPDPSIFWFPSMRGTLDDPGFPAIAARLNLIKYWKTMHVRPDVCNGASPPAFCRMI